jgi:hypothetical protein
MGDTKRRRRTKEHSPNFNNWASSLKETVKKTEKDRRREQALTAAMATESAEVRQKLNALGTIEFFNLNSMTKQQRHQIL